MRAVVLSCLRALVTCGLCDYLCCATVGCVALRYMVMCCLALVFVPCVAVCCHACHACMCTCVHSCARAYMWRMQCERCVAVCAVRFCALRRVRAGVVQAVREGRRGVCVKCASVRCGGCGGCSPS
eukprot:15433448-Alexandrium_andersonii.AAC.1